MKNIRFRTISDVRNYLDSMPGFQTSGAAAANFSLDAIRDFCRRMGDPQNTYKTIHIAGTNGKGTTAHMLHSVYMAAGYRTGLFTSPHLMSFNERFRIDGKLMQDEELLMFFLEFEGLIGSRPLTYFELSVAIAFWYFKLRDVEIAIIETGLGGRLDATNIITPVCSVISSIGLDHTGILGDSLAAIAGEKGGIIKPGVPVVIGDLPEQALDVISEMAARNRSRLVHSLEMEPEYDEGWIMLGHPGFGRLNFRPDIAGKVQSKNAAITATAVHVLNYQFPVTRASLLEGLTTVSARTGLAGRYERLLAGSDWFFDGGHNMEALGHLAGMISGYGGPEKATAVIALNSDKATNDVLDFYKAFNSVYFYRMDGSRSADFDKIADHIPDAILINSENEETSGPLLRFNREEVVIFSGSFYFYPVVKRWLASLESS